MRSLALALGASLLVHAAPLRAQEARVSESAKPADGVPMTFERVFASPGLNGPAPRGVKLSPDGRFVTMLRNRAEDRERYDLWGFERATGEWRMLVDSAKLGSGRALSEAEKMQRERLRIGDLKGIVAYDWAADGQSVLVPLDGDLYLAGIDGSVKRLTDTPDGELNPMLSPKGGYLSFVRDRRVWIGRPGGEMQPVTPQEAAETVHWGEAEFVAQEEMDRHAGAWWAPDDSRIAVQRFDEAQVGIVTRAAIGAEGTKTFPQRYPAAGTPNAEVALHVMKPDGSGSVAVDLGPDKDIYLARVDWAPDARTLYVQRQNRAQTRLDMLAVDPATGVSRVLFSETARDKHWINLSDNYRFLKDGSLVWWSERDGFGHLYRYRQGRWQQLTKGPWVVTDLVGVDEKAGRLFFTGTKDSAIERHVYSLDLAKPASVRRLSEAGWSNSAVMDKTGQALVVSRSSPDHPQQVYVADAAGKRLGWVEENRLDASHPYGPYLSGHRPVQYGTIRAADGSVLHWRMVTPVMEPGKRYPVLFEHYGGPGARPRVTRDWAGSLPQAIADKGFIWFELDNRGTAARGVDFERGIWRAMGGVEVADQLAGLEYLKGLPFVDPAKVATYGWSYGGYMTLKMLQANPGAYAAGIAGAPVTKWELYDTHYTERYLGDPRVVPEVYARSNALADAAKITDPLLVIHGMADDNVVFENASALIARMQADAVPFEMMLYPGQTHKVAGGRLGVHLWESIFGFLERRGITAPK